jgi:hypothetical protein
MPSQSSRDPRSIGRRQYIRFRADAETLAQLSFQEELKDFRPERIGLVVNESYKGCAAVFRVHADIQARRTCIIACGALEPMKARIARIRPLDRDVISVAFEYLS